MKIRFTPEPLLNCQKLYWMRNLGVFEESDTPDLTFAWNWTGTKFNHVEADINAECLDTSKSYVDKIFSEVYGYSSEAHGETDYMAVEKPNNTNGKKDCKIIDCFPESFRKDGYFYQKLLWNGDYLRERRAVIMGGQVVYSFTKVKNVKYNNLPGIVTSYELDPFWKNDRVNEFCSAYVLDYGEIDMITFNGKDYIIDVNPTPGDAAFVHMPQRQSEQFVNDYKTLLEKWLTSLL